MAETPTWAPLVADIIDPGAWSTWFWDESTETVANSLCGAGVNVDTYAESSVARAAIVAGGRTYSAGGDCGASDEDIAATIRRALAAAYVLAGVEAPANVKGGGDV